MINKMNYKMKELPMNNKFFKSVYPFTTEEIAGYFPLLELEEKKVFTVGSSSDQAFNALF